MVPFSDSLELHDSIILLKLARFVSSREQRTIRKDLINIIPKEVDIRPDEWAKHRRIILKIQGNKIEDSESLLKKIAQLPGIKTIIIFKKQNFNFPSEGLSEIVKFTLDAVENINKPLFIKFQAIGSIPFHKRAFRERMDKKRPLINESDETTFNIYLECKEEESQILSRLGLIYSDKKQNSKEDKMDFNGPMSVILFSPYTKEEIADFSRISLNFNFLEVIFSNENNRVPEVIEETSKTTFKGIDKVKFKIIPSLNDFIKKNNQKYLFLGFSLHASKNVHDLKQILEKTDKKLCIIIGNEVRGLEYSTQKMIDMFKLGTGSSEPLRASHVLTYVLGMIN